MPKIANSAEPLTLKPYTAHKVHLEYNDTDKQATGDCPFCGREGKFSVNIKSGLYRCLVCGEGGDKGGGNPTIFLRKLQEHSFKNTPLDKYDTLAKNRGIIYPESLIEWGISWSISGDCWLIPGYSPEGKITQLYRYIKIDGKYRGLATPEVHHGIQGIEFNNKKKTQVFLCEGVWDAIALWEVMKSCKLYEENLVLTGNPGASLLKDTIILAVPGCNVFNNNWCSLFSGADVTILFDSDYPKETNGKKSLPVGYAGVKRITGILSVKSEEPPASISFLEWGKEGYDPDQKDGFDLRDYLLQGKDIGERVKLLNQLLSSKKIKKVPPEWMGVRESEVELSNGTSSSPSKIKCKECSTYKEVVNALRKSVKWTDGLDYGFTTMLACIASTPLIGDQLWVKMISPASSGKSTLCEALSTNKKFVKAKSIIRGFHSGFKTDKKGKKDNSLLSVLGGMTLITKDGDTLLQSPNLSQILSEARDVYDRVSRISFRNSIHRDYENISLTWILCGTNALTAIDASELGERFLTCCIMERIDEDLEDEILWRVVNKTSNNIGIEATEKEGSDPEMMEAMALTGGFVNYLRENAVALIKEIESTDEVKKFIISLGKFVAYMRARPSKKQEEVAEREFAARLVSQITKLSFCLAVVLGKKSLDSDIIKRVRKVALDTARGRVLEICKALYTDKNQGIDIRTLSLITNQGEEGERKLLKFMKKIGVVELHQRKAKKGVMSKPVWKLTESINNLLKTVLE